MEQIKTPKLRKLLYTLILKNIPRKSENTFFKIAERGQRLKLEKLYKMLTSSNIKPTMKSFRESLLRPIDTKPLIQKQIKFTTQNIYSKKYMNTYAFYSNIMKTYIKKFPNSLYKFKLNYYDAENRKIKNYVINDSIITSWKYTFSNYSKNTLIHMVHKTTLHSGSYEWKPRAYLNNEQDGYVIFKIEIYPRVGNTQEAITRIQNYKNSISNTCVYDGIVKFFEMKMERSPADTHAKANYNKLIRSKLQYATSYTDETLSKIGSLVKSSIVIKDYIHGQDKKFNESEFNRYSIEFMNTRYDHLELLTSSFNNPIILENKEELQHIKDVNKYYIQKFGSVYTTDAVYKVKDTDFKIVFDEWKKNNDISRYSISIDSHSYKFLEQYDYTMHRQLNNLEINNELYNELDLRKAYYNYSNIDFNKYYVGVPSGSFIHCKTNHTFDYNKLSKSIVGFFEISIIDCNDKLNKIFERNKHYIFYSSMINLLIAHGAKLCFYNAIYCPSIHIPFTENFLSKEDNISFYAKAVGVFMIENETIDTHIKVLEDDVKYYDIINGKDVRLYKENNIIHVSRQNTDIKSYSHFALAIHSYNHTLVVEEMLKYNYEDILGVKLDSIIIKKTVNIEESKQFKIKPANIETLFYKIDTSGLDEGLNNNNIEIDIITSYFTPCINNLVWDEYFLYSNEYIYETNIFIGGKGGCGKTSSLLRYLEHKNTCFTTSCWNLIEGIKSKNKDVIGLSIPKLTGFMEDLKVDKITNNNIKFVIIDEATLLDINKQIKPVIHEYRYCFNFILGDIQEDGFYYQCSNMNKVIKPMKHIQNLQYIQYTKNYRFDDDLNNNLDVLRNKMIEFKNNIYLLKNWFYTSIFKNRIFNIDDIIYNKQDVGISCNNEMGLHSKGLSNKFIEKGAEEKYFIKTTNLHKNLYRGAALTEKPDHKNYEMKLFKTIHSFQGLELNETNKIIIDLSSIFDYNIIYTALSRAKRMDQIYIIENLKIL